MPHTKQTKTPPKNQKLKTKKLSAFTLVELIITIVILSILSTIAFLSFNSYSSSSRDSVRLSDINSINKSLELYQVNAGRYPDPTNVYMTVTYSGGAIFEQGKLGDTVITAIGKISKKPVDPLKNTEYTYSANMNNSTYQLKVDLEIKPSTGYDDGNNLKDISTALRSAQYNDIIKMTQKVNADTNTGSTVCYIQGNFNGLIEKTNTGNTNYILAVPGMIITDTGALTSNTNIDYNTLSGKVICNGLNSPCIINFTPTVVFVGSGNTMPSTVGDMGAIVGGLKNAYSGSNVSTTNSTISNLLTSSGINIISLGASLAGKVGATTTTNLASTITSYPGCDTPDIILNNGQIWAACNVGATVAFTGVNLTATCSSSCDNDPYPSRHITSGNYYQWGRNDTGRTNGIVGWNYDWQTPRKDGAWGGSGTTSTGGTFYTQGRPDSMQGPCASGYHVPTQYEWRTAISTISPNINYILSWQNNTLVAVTLKLPLAGFKHYSSNTYYIQGDNGNYLTSTPISTNGSDITISGTQIIPLNNHYRAHGFSVRCLKN